jgi:dienelactone hydrolase
MSKVLFRAGMLVVLLGAFTLPAQAQEAGEAIRIRSRDVTLDGRFFRGSDPGPHPTLLLLHGYPGGPGDLFGIGAAAAAAGWNALAVQYTGTHHSEGMYSLENTRGDVAAALQFLRANAESLGVDPQRIAAVGYSAGGWLAFMAAFQHRDVRCVAAVAPGNFGMLAGLLERDPGFAAMVRAGYEAPIRDGVVRGPSWAEAEAEILAHSAEYDLLRHGEALRDRPVLVIGGWRDAQAPLAEMIVPLVRALRTAGNAAVYPVAFDDDHTMGRSRARVRSTVVTWLVDTCAPSMTERPPAGGTRAEADQEEGG